MNEEMENIELTSQRERGKAERRRRIVDSARYLINEHGLDNVSIENIAAHAKVGQATVYNLFSNKNTILAAIFKQELRDFNRKVKDLDPKSPMKKLFIAAEFVVESVEHDPHFFRAMVYASGRGEQRIVAEVTTQRIKAYTDMLQHAVKSGELRKDTNPEILGISLANMISGTALSYTTYKSANHLLSFINYGICLMLSSFASEEGSRILQKVMSEALDVLHSG